MPIVRRRGLFLLICAKRILNRRVAAAIAYREEQVSPASELERIPRFSSERHAHAYAFWRQYRQQMKST